MKYTKKHKKHKKPKNKTKKKKYLLDKYAKLFNRIRGGKLLKQGTYGCIYFEPALDCLSKAIQKEIKALDYEVISKLFTKKNAEIEVEQYKKLDKIDPQYKFHLHSFKTLCRPNPKQLKELQRCEVNHISEYISLIEANKSHNGSEKGAKTSSNKKSMIDIGLFKKESKKNDLINVKDTDFVLFLLEYGGKDIKIMKETFREWTPKKVMEFMKSLDSLFDALIVLNGGGPSATMFTAMTGKKQYIMGDIKPNNIVYNEKAKKCFFIDFGSFVEKEKHLTKLTTYDRLYFYYNFTLETYYLLDEKYYRFMPDDTVVTGSIQTSNFDDKTAYGQYADVVKNVRETIPEKYRQYAKIDEDFKTMVTEMANMERSKFVEKSLITTDLYQLGLSFMYLLDVFQNKIDEKLSNELFKLFYSMMHPNVFQRITPAEASTRYKNLFATQLK